ncbi:hypothetical protein [Vitreimonas sp.]|jgi:hypothetical protein|uniref:hypothetical protein n=1 Tax=Vitreimonas sp. TaxID=3069702 RepID=UPI002EDB8472
MMRKPNIRSALTDVVFVVLAFIAGVANAPLAYAGLIALGSALVWAWTRRTALASMPLARRATNTVLALAMIGAVMIVFYGIGRAAGGHL